jgi:multiple sugar transport system substrate-binding protein
MPVCRVFARAAASAAVLLSTSAVMQAAEISYLTHWAPETVAKLEAAAAAYPRVTPAPRSPSALFLSGTS